MLSAPERSACPWLRLWPLRMAGPSWHLHQAARAPTKPSPAAIWIDCARPVAPSFAAALRRWKRTVDTDSDRMVPTRSEEHTSELQSLMRISYSVFFLKKKKQHNKKNIC